MIVVRISGLVERKRVLLVVRVAQRIPFTNSSVYILRFDDTEQLVEPELPPVSFSSNAFGSTMGSSAGGKPVNSAVGRFER